MEKFVKPCDKEAMRLAMLKHEETFREQVCELHRLYQVQKLLMRNIQRSKHSTEQHQKRLSFFSKEERRFFLEQPAQEAIPNFCGTTFAEETIDETEIELTLGPSSYTKRQKPQKPQKPERTLTSESRPSFSSTESSHANIKCLQTRQWNGTLNKEQVCLVQVPELKSGGQSKSKSIEIEERLRQERLKQPPCIFQVLSLNMT